MGLENKSLRQNEYIDIANFMVMCKDTEYIFVISTININGGLYNG